MKNGERQPAMKPCPGVDGRGCIVRGTLIAAGREVCGNCCAPSPRKSEPRGKGGAA